MVLESNTPDPRLIELPWERLPAILAPLTVALEAVLAGSPAERVLDRLLRDHRAWSAPERALAAELLFGVGLWRRRLAYHLHGPPGDWTSSRPVDLLAAFLVVRAGVPIKTARAWTQCACELRPGAPEDLGCRASLPTWLADHLARELGPEAAAYADALNQPGPVFLRVNTLRTSRDALRARLAEEGIDAVPGAHAATALRVRTHRPNLWSSEAYRDGDFEVQDEGSQLLGALLELRPGHSALDLCAGAGGKTLQLAAAMADQGPLHVYDPDANRLNRLRQRAARAGVRQLSVHHQPPPRGLLVDRVLVDAPCSELGVLRRGPDLRHRLDPTTLTTWPPLQRGLLDQAAEHVAPGGQLLYATCTVTSAENQEVALAFERAHPDFERLRPGEGWLDRSFLREGFFVCLPHLHGTDGFFAALWRRRPSPSR